MPLADTWEVYDNSGSTTNLIARGGRQIGPIVIDRMKWEEFVREKS
jgi:predicted ABC-type ATPase